MNNNQIQEKQLARVDVNIEKWGIFTTTHKTTKKSREITREITLPGGEKNIQKISIGKLEDGTEIGLLGTGEAKIYYLANYLWDKQGRPQDGKINFSILGCLKELGDSTDGKSVYNWFVKKIDRCRLIPIHFHNAYKNKEGEITDIKTVITLFSDYYIFERRKDIKKGPNFSFSSITLHPVIIKSLIDHNVKPIRFDVLKALTHDVSVLLWRHFDLMLFDKTKYERDLVDLAQEIGLSITQEPRHIKRTILKGLDELKGKDLTNGRIINATIEPSQTPSKHKVVITKGEQLPRKPQEEQAPDPKQIYDSLPDNIREQIKSQAQKEMEQGGFFKELSSPMKEKVIEGRCLNLAAEYQKKLKQVKFSFADTNAKEVQIAGDFNNWAPEDMKKTAKGRWIKKLNLLPGKYKYKFVIDGIWKSDPQTTPIDNLGNSEVIA